MHGGARTASGTDFSGRLHASTAALSFPNGLDSWLLRCCMFPFPFLCFTGEYHYHTATEYTMQSFFVSLSLSLCGTDFSSNTNLAADFSPKAQLSEWRRFLRSEYFSLYCYVYFPSSFEFFFVYFSLGIHSLVTGDDSFLLPISFNPPSLVIACYSKWSVLPARNTLDYWKGIRLDHTHLRNTFEKFTTRFDYDYALPAHSCLIHS